MLIPNHPHDERLAALAARDADATADTALTGHVASCVRCTEVVNELGALRAALAELPDLRPSRPLQLVPPADAVHEPAFDRAGAWARRFFAPMLAAGVALAMVGTVGTASPVLQGLPGAASGPAAQDAEVSAEAFVAPAGSEGSVSGGGAAGEDSLQTEMQRESDGEVAEEPMVEDESATVGTTAGEGDQAARTLEDRSPWPMVLFAGIALIIAAALMRWILAPRAG